MSSFGGSATSSKQGDRNPPLPLCPCCSFLPPSMCLPASAESVEENDDGDGNDASESLFENALDALALLARGEVPVLVDSHGHSHLERDRTPQYVEEAEEERRNGPRVVSLTCAVSEDDWSTTLEHAAASEAVRPALGIHPWYVKEERHGEDGGSDDDERWIERLESLLTEHPAAMVGEIGLCKAARNLRTHPEGKSAALQLQRRVFEKQMVLAVRLKRGVSVHCVGQHGVLMTTLKQMRDDDDDVAQNAPTNGNVSGGNKDSGSAPPRSPSSLSLLERFPPVVALHSFSGTAHHVKEILAFEESLFQPPSSPAKKRRHKKKSNNEGASSSTSTSTSSSSPWSTPSLPERRRREPLFYFGFSHLVNVLMCGSAKSRRQSVEAIRSIPSDRILVESDVHAKEDVLAGTAGAVAYVAHALGRPFDEVASLTARNGLRFLRR